MKDNVGHYELKVHKVVRRILKIDLSKGNSQMTVVV